MKKRLMKNILVLAGICSFFALVLGVVNLFTGPIIVENKARREKEALQKLILPDETVGERFPVTEDPLVFERVEVFNGDIRSGMILVLKTNGYGGPITLLGCYDPEGTLVRAVVTDNVETPGIGKNSEERWYMEIFEGTGGAKPVPLTKGELDSTQADALTGATITFTAVSSALYGGSAWIKNNPEVFAP